jgi:arylsulfatase A-like enzyme
MRPLRILGAASLALLGVALGGCRSTLLPEASRKQPNILLIVADDLGYSDLGCYGSEIPTPRLDELAEVGVRATDFYVAPRGAPTRAMLLTGVDNHVAGFSGRRMRAWDQEGEPAQEGVLSSRVVTVASLLRNAGYYTVMAGKWELGTTPGALPHARGFERSFVLHDPTASHWADMKSAVPGRERAFYTRDGEVVERLPEHHFSTEAFTDFVIGGIEEGTDGHPFFAYLSLQAPHGPLAAPDDWRDRFAGHYDDGFDRIREVRLLRMKRKQLVREEVRPYPGIPTVPEWSELSDEQKEEQSRRMEIYAAMVANLDFHVGRLFDFLRETGRYDDTLIVFLSDNGAEPADRGPTGMDPRDSDWYAQQFPDTRQENLGQPGSFVEYGPGWAQVSTVPFRLFKGTQAEGGIRSPLIVAGPGVRRSARFTRPRISRAVLHVTDLAPTFLELAGVEHPKTWQGRSVAPLRGRSLVDHLAGAFRARKGPHDSLGFGYAGSRALRRGRWKLVWMPPPFGADKWRLYRLDHDPSELWDKSAGHPEQVAELSALWERYARENGVPLPDGGEPPVAGR